jgi:hypothetical protein
MADLEHHTLLDSVLRFYALNATTTETTTLAQLCVELAARLQAARGCAEGESSGAEAEDVVASIDAEMVKTHMTSHRCDRAGQIAMLSQALFTASAFQRVLSQNLPAEKWLVVGCARTHCSGPCGGDAPTFTFRSFFSKKYVRLYFSSWVT